MVRSQYKWLWTVWYINPPEKNGVYRRDWRGTSSLFKERIRGWRDLDGVAGRQRSSWCFFSRNPESAAPTIYQQSCRVHKGWGGSGRSLDVLTGHRGWVHRSAACSDDRLLSKHLWVGSPLKLGVPSSGGGRADSAFRCVHHSSPARTRNSQTKEKRERKMSRSDGSGHTLTRLRHQELLNNKGPGSTRGFKLWLDFLISSHIHFFFPYNTLRVF